MTFLLRYFPHIIIGLLLAAAVYWVSESRYDAGWRDADTAAYKRGLRDAQVTADKELRVLLAEARTEAETTRRQVQESNKALEARHAAEIESIRTESQLADASARSERDRLLERVRDSRSVGAASRLPDGRGRVSETATDPAGPAYAEWLVHPGGGEAVIRMAERGERDARQAAICQRYVRAVMQ